MDKTGNYNVSFVVAGISVVVSALGILFLSAGRNSSWGVCRRGQNSGFLKTSHTCGEGTEPEGPDPRQEIER